MGIPSYGQLGQGSILDVWASAKVIKFSISVSTSGNANNAVTGAFIPANHAVVFSSVTNSGSVALASNTCALDVNGTDITPSLNGLSAGNGKAVFINALDSASSDTDILIDGGSGLVTGSGTTTLDFVVVCVPLSSISSL
tara:strand:- start:9048 stop:9467 length:420 start_codon:yes stop_codon:yes gene_type:complete